MKDFLKFTFASVIGVILAGVVFTILGIITLVGIVASSDTETVVKDNSIFVLDFKGSLSERVQENPLQQLLGEEFEAYGLDDILASIKKAKDNDKIKGIYIQPSYLEASYASLEEIRNALLDFKESGKFIVAYADQYAQGMYYLSSVADKIIINPQGSIGWHGAGMQPVFFKNLVSKLGLEVQVFRVGTISRGTVYCYRNESGQPRTDDRMSRICLASYSCRCIRLTTHPDRYSECLC